MNDDFNILDEKTFFASLKNWPTPLLLLVLDCIQDPRNLGACLRSADAFGVQAVILPKNRSVGITKVVSKTARGTGMHIPFVQVTNLSRALLKLQEAGVFIVGTDPKVETFIENIDLKGNIAIVFGNEGDGMRRLTTERCDFLVKIPIKETVESLNVSVACGICLYEVARQRSSK